MSDDDLNDDLDDTPNGERDEEAGMPRLADLQATDALLDRLGGRSSTDADRADPTVADLAALVTFVERSAQPDSRLEGLLEVLDGRPLYPIREDHRATVEAADQPIDLTGPTAPEPAASPAHPAEVPAARSTQDVVSLAGARLRRVTRAGDGGDALPPWRRTLGKAAMPAAAVILAVGLGGGVTAAVTGNPMAPLDGISRVASQLPGMKPKDDRQVESARQDLAQATDLRNRNRPEEARAVLARAQDTLNDVPESKRGELQGMIADLTQDLNNPNPVVPPDGGVLPPAPSTVPQPSAAPAPGPAQSAQPSATAPATPATATPPPVTPKPSASIPVSPAPATEASGGGNSDPSGSTGAAVDSP